METEAFENSSVFSCRACLQVTSVMYPLFDEYEAGISMASILQAYLLPNKIVDHINLPSQLCVECAITLVKFHNFIVIYRETQDKLCTFQPTENNLTDFHCHDEYLSLASEQIIIQANGSDDESKYIFEIKPETVSDHFEYIEESDYSENLKYEENNTTESLEREDEKNSLLFSDHNESNINLTVYDTDVNQYHCPYCDDVFLYTRILNSHLNKTHNITELDCSINTTSTKRRVFIDQDGDSDITDTNSNKKISYGPRHSCKLCEKSFLSVKALRIHESSHKRIKKYTILCAKDSEKQFICDICGRGFKRKAYLNEHHETHNIVRRLYDCPICHKLFKGRSNFARHKRSHFEAKGQHICEVCGVGFNLRSTLKTHFFLKHVRERNFQCLICSQFFSLKSTLEKHLRRHQYREGSVLAVKFSCSGCHMKYLDKSSLKRHIELKHKMIKFECIDCDKDYTTFTNLAKHRTKKHPDKPVDIFTNKRLCDSEWLEKITNIT